MNEINKKSNRASPSEAPTIIKKNSKWIPGKNKIRAIKYTHKKIEKTIKEELMQCKMELQFTTYSPESVIAFSILTTQHWHSYSLPEKTS